MFIYAFIVFPVILSLMHTMNNFYLYFLYGKLLSLCLLSEIIHLSNTKCKLQNCVKVPFSVHKRVDYFVRKSC